MPERVGPAREGGCAAIVSGLARQLARRAGVRCRRGARVRQRIGVDIGQHWSTVHRCGEAETDASRECGFKRLQVRLPCQMPSVPQ